MEMCGGGAKNDGTQLKKMATILNTSTGQVKNLVEQAIAVGIIDENGNISDLAQNVVNSMIAKKARDFKN